MGRHACAHFSDKETELREMHGWSAAKPALSSGWVTWAAEGQVCTTLEGPLLPSGMGSWEPGDLLASPTSLTSP